MTANLVIIDWAEAYRCGCDGVCLLFLLQAKRLCLLFSVVTDFRMPMPVRDCSQKHQEIWKVARQKCWQAMYCRASVYIYVMDCGIEAWRLCLMRQLGGAIFWEVLMVGCQEGVPGEASRPGAETCVQQTEAVSLSGGLSFVSLPSGWQPG